MVCRNPGIRLHAALESIWAQTRSPELIVIDGASTDGTAEWLESQHQRINTLVSEPDAGIYDAMNKGISNATGEWVFFLGADDRLANAAVLAGVSAALVQTNAAILVGEARFDDGRLYSFADKHTAIRRNFVHHQATFYRRTLFQRHGGFDTRLLIQADYDLNLSLLKRGEKFSPLALRVSDCASGGLSDSGRWTNYREEITVRHRHFPACHCWPWDALSAVRFLRKNLLKLPRHA